MRQQKLYKISAGFLILLLLAGTVNAKDDLSVFVGEKATYTIKKLKVDAGTATISFDGLVEKEGKQYILITFTAKGFNFFDEEKIFADPKTLLPQIVVRDINIFGKKEKITETYEPQNGKVRIVKVVDGKTTEQELKKSGTIDNIYCFIYRYRQKNEFKIGDTVKINLPTTDVTIKLAEKVKLSVAGQKREAYFMKSSPSKYKIWFDVSTEKIPLRIDGASGFGNTSMIMKEYQGKGKK